MTRFGLQLGSYLGVDRSPWPSLNRGDRLGSKFQVQPRRAEPSCSNSNRNLQASWSFSNFNTRSAEKANFMNCSCTSGVVTIESGDSINNFRESLNAMEFCSFARMYRINHVWKWNVGVISEQIFLLTTFLNFHRFSRHPWIASYRINGILWEKPRLISQPWPRSLCLCC